MTTTPEQTPGSNPENGYTALLDLAQVGLNTLKALHVAGGPKHMPIGSGFSGESVREPTPSSPLEALASSERSSQAPSFPAHTFRHTAGSEERADIGGSLPQPPVDPFIAKVKAEMLPYLREERGLPNLKLPKPSKNGSLKKNQRITPKRIMIAGAASVATVGVLFTGLNVLKGKDVATASPVASATPTGSPSPSREPLGTKPLEKTNLDTTLTAANIIDVDPIATVGFNTGGSITVVYKGKDGKNHELKEYDGQRFTWALVQGIEYYVVPKKANVKPFTVKKEKGKTIVTVDLKHYSMKLDPTIHPNQANLDGTVDQFALDPYDKPPLSAKEVDQVTANAINKLITEPTTQLERDKYATPQEWSKLPDKDQLATIGFATNFFVTQQGVLENIQAKDSPCGNVAEVFNQSAAKHVEANIRAILTGLEVDTSNLVVKVVGSLENNALDKLMSSSAYGKVYTETAEVRKKLLKPTITSMACTVTPTEVKS